MASAPFDLLLVAALRRVDDVVPVGLVLHDQEDDDGEHHRALLPADLAQLVAQLLDRDRLVVLLEEDVRVELVQLAALGLLLEVQLRCTSAPTSTSSRPPPRRTLGPHAVEEPDGLLLVRLLGERRELVQIGPTASTSPPAAEMNSKNKKKIIF
jgi:hypothetical protein